jgi:hypothetical protein
LKTNIEKKKEEILKRIITDKNISSEEAEAILFNLEQYCELVINFTLKKSK